jgi:hypothetical protein
MPYWDYVDGAEETNLQYLARTVDTSDLCCDEDSDGYVRDDQETDLEFIDRVVDTSDLYCTENIDAYNYKDDYETDLAFVSRVVTEEEPYIGYTCNGYVASDVQDYPVQEYSDEPVVSQDQAYINDVIEEYGGPVQGATTPEEDAAVRQVLGGDANPAPDPVLPASDAGPGVEGDPNPEPEPNDVIEDPPKDPTTVPLPDNAGSGLAALDDMIEDIQAANEEGRQLLVNLKRTRDQAKQPSQEDKGLTWFPVDTREQEVDLLNNPNYNPTDIGSFSTLGSNGNFDGSMTLSEVFADTADGNNNDLEGGVLSALSDVAKATETLKKVAASELKDVRSGQTITNKYRGVSGNKLSKEEYDRRLEQAEWDLRISEAKRKEAEKAAKQASFERQQAEIEALKVIEATNGKAVNAPSVPSVYVPSVTVNVVEKANEKVATRANMLFRNHRYAKAAERAAEARARRAQQEGRMQTKKSESPP